MKKLVLIFLLVFPSVIIFAQEGTEYTLSLFQHNNESDYYYCLPWNYNNAQTDTKLYPLVIYLHGAGSYGEINSLDYLGYSVDDQNPGAVAKNFQINYPSFVLVPQSKQGWDTSKIIPIIEDFISKYPIDRKRIYLIGHSMGGSGTYILANGYYDYNRTLFAAIIRLAGQSQTILRDSVAFHTSVWLHIGLDDSPQRIDTAREAYNFLRLKNPDTTEFTEKINIGGITGTTTTLKRDNSAIINKTEYDGTGHDIYRFPFDDKRLISWLFSKKLDYYFK